MTDPVVAETLADWLDGVEPWQREALRDQLRTGLLLRAQDRYPYPLVVATDVEVWSLFTPTERALWWALEDLETVEDEWRTK